MNATSNSYYDTASLIQIITVDRLLPKIPSLDRSRLIVSLLVGGLCLEVSCRRVSLLTILHFTAVLI